MDWLKKANDYKDEMIRDIQALVDIPSILDEDSVAEGAPFGLPIRNALDLMLDMGRRDGFETKDVDGFAGIVEFGEGVETVGILGHLDVVPIDKGWMKNPFVSIVEDGVLFGRGSSDDKGPMLAAYYAMRILKDNGIRLNKKVRLIAGCDEETGMRCMEYYKKHEPVPSMGFVPDSVFPVIYGEKGILDVAVQGSIDSIICEMHAGTRSNIVISEAECVVCAAMHRDLFEFYLKSNELNGTCEQVGKGTHYRIEGISAHGARPWLGVNAAWHLLNFIGTCYDDEFAKNSAYLLKDWMASRLNNYLDGVHMGFLSVNLGKVDVAEGRADIVLDIRYPNDISASEVLERIRRAFVERNYAMNLDVIQCKPPLFHDPNSELIKMLTEAYRRHSGDCFTPLLTMAGGTYARTMENFVAFGAGFTQKPLPRGVGAMHGNDEGVLIESLVTACAIYADALYHMTR